MVFRLGSCRPALLSLEIYTWPVLVLENYNLGFAKTSGGMKMKAVFRVCLVQTNPKYSFHFLPGLCNMLYAVNGKCLADATASGK